jgi:hypothetical protein
MDYTHFFEMTENGRPKFFGRHSTLQIAKYFLQHLISQSMLIFVKKMYPSL